jgi:AraC-like DNA-binding protein/Flp pilus assembly protein TadD
MAEHRPTSPAARRAVRRAVAFLRDNLSQPVRTEDLAAACGVAERTLHGYFLDVLGIGPQRLHQRMRLAAARRALTGDDGSVRVTDVALRYGFAHFGRFAAAYRTQFGETPSTSRQRAAEEEAPSHTALRRQRPELSVSVFSNAGSALAQTVAEAAPQQIAAHLAQEGALAVRLAMEPLRQGERDRARYRLQGSVVVAGLRLRVTLRLLDAATAEHLWGDSLDGEAADPFGLLDRIAIAVLYAAAPRIRQAEIGAALTRPWAREARDMVLRCMPSAFVTVPPRAAGCLASLAEAIDRDPDDPVAPALAAWCRTQLVLHHGSPDPARERIAAVGLADRAGALDGTDAMVLTARAAVSTMAGEHDRGEALAARAVAVDPNCAWAWERRGYLRAYLRDSAGALACFEQSLRLPWPEGSRTNTMAGIGLAHTIADRYEEARRWTLAALAGNPGATWINRQLALVHTLCGDGPAARASVEALRRAHPHLSMSVLLGAFHHCPKPVRLMETLKANGLPD